MAVPIHIDLQLLSVLAGQQLQTGSADLLLTDAMVAASATITALQGQVSGLAVAADVQPIQNDINQGIFYGNNAGTIPNNPSSLSTAAALVAATGLDTSQRPSTGPMMLD